ncbi:MAG: glyoxalase [Gammaproteobacteria bacterium RIFCSPHIGHO2_12_FULL_63_22]|nr:MAG: glyoxalase [Gammaproteobacteria bacterium RIFCSPHIGHO2_12_FULL_63_22]
MSNPFVHVELNSNNLGKAQAFYGKLFDWKTQDTSLASGQYTTIDVGKGTGGGMNAHQLPGEQHSTWLPYVEVDDVKAATKKAISLGGTVIKDVTEIPDMGVMSIICDPTGANLGLWQPKSTQRAS